MSTDNRAREEETTAGRETNETDGSKSSGNEERGGTCRPLSNLAPAQNDREEFI